MKKIFRLFSLVASVSVLACLAACTAHDLDTNQYPADGVTLASYGPNPVMRGATLRFFGANLDKVIEVQVPGVSPITSIEVVKSGSPSEIRIQLPVEGPEVGRIVLKTSDGMVLTTQAELTYTEPIVFDSFSAAEVNYPGDVVTIKGDYINLVSRVIFEGGESSAIIPGDRHTATVVIPSTAVTGKIILTDDAEIANLLYSEADLVIGDPTVYGLKAPVCKPGQPVTISGKYLDMIESIRFADGVVVKDFEPSEDGISIVVPIPSAAVSGDVVAVSYAGKDFKAGSIEMVVPTELVAAPQPVKAGAELTITGKDLDLVTGVNLPGASNVAYTYSGDKVVLTVPAGAKEGDVALVMANGVEVTAPYTLVLPTVTGVSPVELKAGETFAITGTDLDLVTEVTLGGKKEMFEATETQVTVTTSATSVSGKLVLKLANGEQIEPEQAVTINYDSFIVVNEMPAAEHIGATVTLKGANFMMIESIYIGEAKVTQYSLRTDDEIAFVMPYNKVGTYDMTFHLIEGDVETCPQPIEVLLELSARTIWEGNVDLGSWSGNVQLLVAEIGALPSGSTLRISYTAAADTYPQFKICDINWTLLPGFEAIANEWGVVPLSTEANTYELALTAADIDAILNHEAGWGGRGLVIAGQQAVVTKVEVISEIPQEITIYEGPTSLTWGDDGRFGLAMTYFEKATAGSKLIVYFHQTENWGQVQFNDGWWGNADIVFPEFGGAYLNTDNIGGKDVERVELTLTDSLLEVIRSRSGDYFGLNTQYKGDGRCGMIIQGSDWVIEKITIL